MSTSYRLYNEKGVKEREGVNETPRRGGCCYSLLLGLTPFYSCCSGFGPDAKNLPF